MDNLSLDTYNINFIENIIENKNLSNLDFPDLIDTSNFNDINKLNTSKLCNAVTYSKYQSLLNFVNMELHRLTLLKRCILQSAKENFVLNDAQCNFRKTTNQIYHLYQKESNKKYLSLISLSEWGPKFKDHYIGSYKLKDDLTWEEV